MCCRKEFCDGQCFVWLLFAGGGELRLEGLRHMSKSLDRSIPGSYLDLLRSIT